MTLDGSPGGHDGAGRQHRHGAVRARSRGGDRHRSRAGAPAEHAGDDRLGELRARSGDAGARVGADEQVRRGLPGQALLRRLRARRRRRVARHRARQGALRRRFRQRPAPLGRPGERGSHARPAQAGRHDPRARAGPRWTPHARHAPQLLRPAVRGGRLRSARGLPRHRHGGGRAPARRYTGRR